MARLVQMALKALALKFRLVIALTEPLVQVQRKTPAIRFRIACAQMAMLVQAVLLIHVRNATVMMVPSARQAVSDLVLKSHDVIVMIIQVVHQEMRLCVQSPRLASAQMVLRAQLEK